MQAKVKTLLNRTPPIPGFCYADVRLVEGPGEPELRVEIKAHGQRRGRCSICERPAPTYDHRARREWRHVGLWRIVTRLFYAPRRVACPEHGIRVVVSDMWRPYPAVVRKDLSQAVRIPDRFHLTALLNKAVDLVRRAEGDALRGQARGQRLKKTRWRLLKPRARVRGKARVVTRRSYGFRAFPVLNAALFHTLGKLPEPKLTRRFR